jgi:multidrug efflux pump subunit AcrB
MPLSVSLPQLSVSIDRTQVKSVGVPISDVFSTLQAMWGSLYINDFDQFGRVWRVQLQAAPEFRAKPQNLADLYVRNAAGTMIPLAGLLSERFVSGPNVVSRFNGFTSVQITGAPAPGYSTGQAMTALREVAQKTLLDGFSFEFSGASLQEIRAGNQAPLVIGFGLVMVFLILAAQYEKWSLPLSVLLGIPIGLVGAYGATLLRGLNSDIFLQIGLLTLVGLAAKNAILIVEFCVTQRASGKSLTDAAVEAARQRFRPILMTSFTFILGCVPLAISTGAGAGSRISIGTGVIGGMLAATLLLIFFVPLFYVIVQGAAEFFGRKAQPAAAPLPQTQ